MKTTTTDLPIYNEEQSTTEFFETLTDEQIIEVYKENDTPDCILENLLYYFAYDDVSWSWKEVINPEKNKGKIIEVFFYRPQDNNITKLSICNDFDKCRIVNNHIYIKGFKDFLLLYHEKYSFNKLKEFSKVNADDNKELIGFILQKIDIINYFMQPYGLKGFYDSTSFHILNSIKVYCKYFGIEINLEHNNGSGYPTQIDANINTGTTYYLTILNPKRREINKIVINENFESNCLHADSNTISINSFLGFLYLRDELEFFLEHKIIQHYKVLQLNSIH